LGFKASKLLGFRFWIGFFFNLEVGRIYPQHFSEIFLGEANYLGTPYSYIWGFIGHDFGLTMGYPIGPFPDWFWGSLLKFFLPCGFSPRFQLILTGRGPLPGISRVWRRNGFSGSGPPDFGVSLHPFPPCKLFGNNRDRGQCLILGVHVGPFFKKGALPWVPAPSLGEQHPRVWGQHTIASDGCSNDIGGGPLPPIWGRKNPL